MAAERAKRERGTSPRDFALAVLITGAAILIRVLAGPVLGAAVPFMTCYAAAIWLAATRGVWPALTSVALSATAGTYYIIGVRDLSVIRPLMSERNLVVLFVLVAAATSWFIDLQRRTLLRARAAEAAQRDVAEENARLFAEAESMRREMEHSNNELKRFNADLEAFAYSASHDLQEPLRTITIFAQMLAGGCAETGEETHLKDQIVKAARRSSAMVRDVLDYARAGRVDASSPPLVDASVVLNEVVATLSPAIAETGADITTDRLPSVPMHGSHLAQIFQNLIANALKYRSEAPPQIQVSAETIPNEWVFSVRDNGIGIEPRHSEKIFKDFERLHTQEAYPGTGLGLATCRRIVGRYGGRIWLEDSPPGRGSVFCFSIPQSVEVRNDKDRKILGFQSAAKR